MNTVRDVVVIVGSLRKESLNRKMAKALRAMAPASMKLEIVEIGDLPLFNADLEANPPPAAVAFKARVKKADAVLFVTPEYNRSVPGALKNAIDVGSRPKGQSAWEGKPCAIVSVAPGAIGAFGANHHLRQSMVFLNMPAMILLYRRGRQAVRRGWQSGQRLHARFHAEVSGRICSVDRSQRSEGLMRHAQMP